MSTHGDFPVALCGAVVVIAYLVDPEREKTPPTSQIHKAVDWSHLPMAAGIMVISLSGKFLSTSQTRSSVHFSSGPLSSFHALGFVSEERASLWMYLGAFRIQQWPCYHCKHVRRRRQGL